jgi:hypothetical protein
VDFPSTASFLTPEERAFIIEKKSKTSLPTRYPIPVTYGYVRYVEYDNSSVGEEEHFATRHIVAALTDWQLYIQLLIYMSIVAPRKFEYCCPARTKNQAYEPRRI